MRTIHHTIALSSKKMAQWRTFSTHDSIHMGVIGRFFRVHFTHQIHGGNMSSLLFPEGQQSDCLRHLIQGVNWTMLYKHRKKGVRINSKSLERKVYAPRLEPTAPIYIYIYKKKETLWVSGKYIKKNWRAAGLELTTSAPSRTIVTDGNCLTTRPA